MSIGAKGFSEDSLRMIRNIFLFILAFLILLSIFILITGGLDEAQRGILCDAVCATKEESVWRDIVFSVKECGC